MYSSVDLTRVNPAQDTSVFHASTPAGGLLDAFSRTLVPEGAGQAMLVNLGAASTADEADQTTSQYFRCVRGG
jgi:hypothetical protein